MSTILTEMEPGIYPDMPMAEYLALPFMSGSKLEVLRRSPLQLLHSLKAPRVETPALALGSAVHMALLEPLLFKAHYAVAGECQQPLKSGARKGEPCGTRGLYLHRDLGWLCGLHVKGCGDGLDTSTAILSQDQYNDVVGMRDAVMAHKRARTLFDGAGAFEVTVIWRDEETGVMCKARPDRLVERVGMHVALKTTRDAAPWAFPRHAEQLGYFRSLAFYRRGLRAVGWPYQSTALLAVENSAPYDIVPYLPDEAADLDSANAEVSSLMRLFKTCEDTGIWPGYADEFIPLTRPGWAKEAA